MQAAYVFGITITFRLCCESVNSPSALERQKNRRFSRLISRLQAVPEEQDVWITGEALEEAGRSTEINPVYWRDQVRADRSDAKARWYLAESQALSGNLPAALADWRKILVLRPDAAPAALRLAQLSFHSGEVEEAMRWLKRMANRRPDDEQLVIAILGLCLSEGQTREARALAELFLATRARTSGCDEALFHIFRLFDDTGRARQASGLDNGSAGRSPDRLWLAVRAALWSVDGSASVALLAALGDVAPGGNVMARKAMAQHRFGDTDSAALTLASAVQQFLASPAQLADLAASLAWPSLAPLRQVVLSTLQRLAVNDPEAAAALALAHYRLGDWASADAVIKTSADHPVWPELAVVLANLANHKRTHDSLPANAAAFAFTHAAVELHDRSNGTDPEADDAPALLIVGDDLGPGEREMLIRALGNVAPAVSVIELGDLRSDTPGGEMAAILSECFFGTDSYLFGAAGHIEFDDAGEPDNVLGYLPPQLAAEILWLRDHIQRIGPRSVHIAGAGVALSGGLGAMYAGVKQVRLHAGPGWLERGLKRQGYFRAGVVRLLADRRFRLVSTSVNDDATLDDVLTPVVEPVRTPAGIDGRAMRQEARLIHRLRASETLGVLDDQQGCSLVSVFGLADDHHLERFRQVVSRIDPGKIRFVVWADQVGPVPALSGAEDQAVTVLRWPGNAGAFLVHCRLGLAWGKKQSELQALAHAAVSVPVLAVDGADLTMPTVDQCLSDSLPARLPELLGQSDHLESIAEGARLWVQSNRPLRRLVRRIQRLDGFPDPIT